MEIRPEALAAARALITDPPDPDATLYEGDAWRAAALAVDALPTVERCAPAPQVPACPF